jgi:hypothetical protein
MDVDIPSTVGDFKLLTEEKLEFADVKIVKWRSESTGLRVVWADVEGEGASHAWLRGFARAEGADELDLRRRVQDLSLRAISLPSPRSSMTRVDRILWCVASLPFSAALC